MSAAFGSFQNTSPTGGIWNSLNKLLGVLIFITLLAAAGYRFLPEVTKRREQKARLDQLNAAVERERLTLARNLKEEEALKHDPEYVALMARDKLDLRRWDETIFRFDTAPSAKTKPARR